MACTRVVLLSALSLVSLAQHTTTTDKKHVTKHAPLFDLDDIQNDMDHSIVNSDGMKLGEFAIENSACGGGCDDSCDYSCDDSCNGNCGGGCDAGCDYWGIFSCDDACDTSCTTNCDTGCDGCDTGCDDSCGCSSEDSWYSLIQSSISDIIDVVDSSSDTSVLLYDCYDTSMMTYYEEIMKLNSFDNKNKKHNDAKIWHDRRTNKIKLLKEIGITYDEFRRDRLKHLSITKQKELGIDTYLQSNNIIPSDFELYPDSTCSTYATSLYYDLDGELDDLSSALCGGLSFSIGWTVSYVIYEITESAGIAIGASDFGIIITDSDGWVTFSIGTDFFASMGYEFSFSDISGAFYEIAVSVDVEVVSFGISYGFDDNDNWSGIAASCSVGYGISSPITLSYDSGYTYYYSLLSMFSSKNEKDINLLATSSLHDAESELESNGIMQGIFTEISNTNNYALGIICGIIVLLWILLVYKLLSNKKSSSNYNCNPCPLSQKESLYVPIGQEY